MTAYRLLAYSADRELDRFSRDRVWQREVVILLASQL